MNEPQGNKARVHIRITGHVQGVGFRAHVEYFARQTQVTGWVRNVGFDMVEAVAEGERERLELFIRAVKQGPRGSRVDEAQVEWEEATGEFPEFAIKRSL